MRAPQLEATCAREILALVDAAKVHAPGHELAWLVGWAMRASGEPVSARAALHQTERALRDSLRAPNQPEDGPPLAGPVVHQGGRR